MDILLDHVIKLRRVALSTCTVKLVYICIDVSSNEYLAIKAYFADSNRGWSGGAMVLGKLPAPGRPGVGRVVRWSWVNFQCRGVLLVWIRVGQGPTALAVGAGGVVWTFLLSSILSLLFLLLFGRRPDID